MSGLTDQIDLLKSNLEDLEAQAKSYTDLSDFTFPEGYDEDSDGLEQLIDAYNQLDSALSQLGDMDADDIRVGLKKLDCDSVRDVFTELESMQKLVGIDTGGGRSPRPRPIAADDLEAELRRIGLPPGIDGITMANGRAMALYDWLRTLPDGWVVASAKLDAQLDKARTSAPPVSTGPEVPAGFVAISIEELQHLIDIAIQANGDSFHSMATAHEKARAYYEKNYPLRVFGPKPRPAEPTEPPKGTFDLTEY